MPTSPTDRAAIINDVISHLVPRHSFADVGGLWGLHNERVTIAARADAARVAMIDICPPGQQAWIDFDNHAKSLNVPYEAFSGNIDDPMLAEKVGQFDVVHCSGVLYHVPNPIHTLTQLRKMTRKHLLLGSMTVPPEIANESGRVDFTDGRLIFVPGLRGVARACIRSYFDERKLHAHNINTREAHPWRGADTYNYAAWWWLWTSETLRSLCEAAGLRVFKSWVNWPGMAHYIWCRIM